MVGTTAFSSSRLGFEFLSCQMFLRFILSTFWCPKLFKTLKGSFTKIFGTLRQKKFWRELVIPPSMHKVLRYPKFSETLKWCPRNFSALWDKKFSNKNCDNPYCAWKFSIPQIFWDIEGMPNFFGTVRQKIFDRKLWYPLLCIKFFDIPIFPKHWSDAHEIFRHWDQKFLTERRDTPFSFIKLFETKKILKNSRIP